LWGRRFRLEVPERGVLRRLFQQVNLRFLFCFSRSSCVGNLRLFCWWKEPLPFPSIALLRLWFGDLSHRFGLLKTQPLFLSRSSQRPLFRCHVWERHSLKKISHYCRGRGRVLSQCLPVRLTLHASHGIWRQSISKCPQFC
jgi:hypothetical protein